jgi:hypothetical protein
MTLQPTPFPVKPNAGSPYCADPDCPHCASLRQVEDQVRTGRPILPPKDLPSKDRQENVG